MSRDISNAVLVRKLKLHGLKIEYMSDGEPWAVRYPHGGGSVFLTGAAGLSGPRRWKLAYCLKRLDAVIERHERALLTKAAWDAEFAQPIEPRFVAEIDALEIYGAKLEDDA